MERRAKDLKRSEEAKEREKEGRLTIRHST